MIKLIPMPNPFKVAFESYEMTNLGKAIIATTVAEVALKELQNNGSFSNPIQETWSLYGRIIQVINKKPNLVSWWNNISNETKKSAMIELFCKEGKGHLVPYLQQNIFPTF